MERQAYNMMKKEERLLNNVFKKPNGRRPSDRWLSQTMNEAFDNLEATIRLQNTVRMAPKKNRSWLTK